MTCVAAALPDPATLGDRMHGKTCAGTLVTGTGKDGEPRARCTSTTSPTTSETMREYGSQAVVLADRAQPRVALELLADRRLERHRRARPRGVRRGAVPRPARGLRRAARPRRPVSQAADAQSARTSAAWPVAALVLGAGLLALLLVHPGIDESWENHPAHFWLVLGAASISVGLGYAVGVAARRRRDARLFLVSLAFISAAGFLGLHALATPGVLLGKNAGFELATPFGLAVAGLFAAASGCRSGRRRPSASCAGPGR